MFEVTIVSHDGWACGSGDTPEEAFAVAMCAAEQGATSIQAALGTPTNTSDPVARLIGSLPEEVRAAPELLTVISDLRINGSTAELYMRSPHRRDYLIREIKRKMESR